LPEVLAVSPPAKVINLLQRLVRAVEQRNVVPQKPPGVGVADGGGIGLFIAGVEAVNIMLEALRLEDGLGGGGPGLVRPASGSRRWRTPPKLVS